MGIVKLPAPAYRRQASRGDRTSTARLPGNLISLILCPFTPPIPQGRDRVRSGHLKVQSGNIIVIAILLRLCYVPLNLFMRFTYGKSL